MQIKRKILQYMYHLKYLSLMPLYWKRLYFYIHHLYLRNSNCRVYKPNVILFLLFIFFFAFKRKMLLTFDLAAWKSWVELTLSLNRSVKTLQQRNVYLADTLQSHVSSKLLIKYSKTLVWYSTVKCKKSWKALDI